MFANEFRVNILLVGLFEPLDEEKQAFYEGGDKIGESFVFWNATHLKKETEKFIEFVLPFIK